MTRIQFQLDEATHETLREIAHRKRQSLSSVIREILHKHLAKEAGAKGLRGKRFSFISAGASGRKDISVRHDEALTELTE